MIEKFAGYGFNKSHSTAYALIAYMTAYLKAHYPVEFMAALLSGDMDAPNFKKKDSLVEHLEDCRRMNIEVVPPDVNRSEADFTVADGKILFGLCAIKGCGMAAMQALVAARSEGRTVPRSCSTSANASIRAQINRATIETLIKAGAFDSLGAPALATHGRAGTGHSSRARRCTPIARADRRGCSTCSRKTPAARPPAGAARHARVGRSRAAGGRKRSARLLPVQPSAGRARKDAGHLLLAHDDRLASLPHRTGSDPGRHALVASSSRRPRTRDRAARHQVRDVRSGGHARLDALHSLARGFATARAPGRGRRHAGGARRDRSPAGERRSQHDRQRIDSARRTCHGGSPAG